MRAPRGALCRVLVAAFAGVVVATVTPAPSAHAQSAPPGKEQAKKLFEDGVELEKKADYAGALARYRDAEQITSTPGLRFHKGYCLEMLGKIATALEEYEAADKMAREQKKQDVHAAITARLEPLRARVPQIAIRLATAARDPDILLDGAPVGALLLDGTAFRVDPGEHALVARAPGHRTFTRKVQVPEAMTTTVDILLERASPTAAGGSGPEGGTQPAAAGGSASGPAPGAMLREPAPGRSLVLPLVTTAGTVVLAVTGVALVVAAGAVKSDGEAACPRKVSCEGEQSNIRRLDAFALGSFVGAAGLGAVSVILWTSRPGARSASLEQSPPARARVVATPGLVGFAGTF